MALVYANVAEVKQRVNIVELQIELADLRRSESRKALLQIFQFWL